jgi:hypothetical protein
MILDRVLVVEPDVDLGSALRDMLEAEGCAVIEARSLDAALGVLRREPAVGLVLVNLGPRLRVAGPALGALRAAAGGKVVGLTALPRSGLPRDLPVDALLELPFTLGDLCGAIGWREQAAEAPARSRALAVAAA